MSANAKQKVPVKVVVATLVGVLVMLALYYFSFSSHKNFVIPTGAMIPTILIGERVTSNRVSLSDIHRGQVVFYVSPAQPNVTFVKRVIGMGGDVIRVDGRKLYINGKLVPTRPLDGSSEPEVQAMLGGHDLFEENLNGITHQILWAKTKSPVPEGEFNVPEGHIFLMGDNRSNSLDSRSEGPTAASEVFATPGVVFFSMGEAGVRWHRVGKQLR